MYTVFPLQSGLAAKLEKDTVDQLKQHWSGKDFGLSLVCAGDFTRVGFQSVMNLLSKDRVLDEDTDDHIDPERCRWSAWHFRYGTAMFSPAIRDPAFDREHEVADEYGLTSVDEGKAYTTDVRKCLTSRVEHITARGFERAPAAITVITGPDACNWNDSPQREEAKHLTSWVISPNLCRPPPVTAARARTAARTSVNMMHSTQNCFVAVAFEGNDNHENLDKYLGPYRPTRRIGESTARKQIADLQNNGIDFEFKGQQVHADIELW